MAVKRLLVYRQTGGDGVCLEEHRWSLQWGGGIEGLMKRTDAVQLSHSCLGFVDLAVEVVERGSDADKNCKTSADDEVRGAGLTCRVCTSRRIFHLSVRPHSHRIELAGQLARALDAALACHLQPLVNLLLLLLKWAERHNHGIASELHDVAAVVQYYLKRWAFP